MVSTLGVWSSDKRFFMKGGGKIKKMKNTVAAAARIAAHKRTSQLLGPRMFAMDRMLAIFYVIVDMQSSINADVLSQVSSLVSLGLLAQVGNLASMDSGLDAPKFKCNVRSGSLIQFLLFRFGNKIMD